MTDYLPFLVAIFFFFRRGIFHQIKKIIVGANEIIIFENIFRCNVYGDGGGNVSIDNLITPSVYLYITDKEYIFREKKSYKELGRISIDSVNKIYDKTVEEHLKRLGDLGERMIEDRRKMARSSKYIPNTLIHTMLLFNDESGKSLAEITFYCKKDLTDFYSKIK